MHIELSLLSDNLACLIQLDVVGLNVAPGSEQTSYFSLLKYASSLGNVSLLLLDSHAELFEHSFLSRVIGPLAHSFEELLSFVRGVSDNA